MTADGNAVLTMVCLGKLGCCLIDHDWIDDGISGDQRLVLAVKSTLESLLENEDIDGDGLITIEDPGPKV